jgi:hypothetical protein
MPHIRAESHLRDMPATDEVIDEIAEIEAQRQALEQEAGVAAALSGALRRLHELLDGGRQSLQLRGPQAGHPANVDTVAAEIERVKGLARFAKPDLVPVQSARPEPRQISLRSETRNPPRNKGRRTMGRTSGR